ncbi:sensor histidine kinase [Acutalibacter muris]|uniref:sensor histidine kinase n=1 Tax=Acutalibacter muris TaxID=1796620 RepID=UPI003FA43FDC
MVKQKKEAEGVYFKMLEGKYDDQRVLIHDLRRHLTAIKGLAQEQGADSVVDYVTKIKELPALQNRIRYCKNPMLNVVLSRYEELCYERGIAFQVEVRDKEYDFIAPNDITALFGNLLENAVEAAQNTAEPYVELHVGSPAVTDLFLSLTNPCSHPPREDGRGGFLTRKLNKEQHGIGLKSVKAIVRKYDGTLNHEYDRETKLFNISVLLKDKV